MSKRPIVLAVALALALNSAPSFATELGLDLVVAVTATIVDWGQTRYVVQHPDKFHELNKKMGSSPSMGTVNRHFSQLLARDLILGSILPSPLNHLYFGAVSIAEIKATRHNRSIGVKFSF